jgi:hypothetical protein
MTTEKPTAKDFLMILKDDFTAIAELDLDPIKVKLMHKESGEGWTLAYANAIEAEYRRFLYLSKMFPDESAAPLFDVDVFWHYHILDTLKYMADCDQVFGHYLHHFPYVGLRGEDDMRTHAQAGVRMQELYEETFGEPYLRQRPEKNGAIQTAFCGGPGKAADSLAAFCGGPGKAADSLTAFCGGPGKAADSLTAFCGGPGKATDSRTAWSTYVKPLANGRSLQRPTLAPA